MTTDYPRYRCHKEVRAFKIAEIWWPDPNTAVLRPNDPNCRNFVVTPEFMRKHIPVAGGYLVVYEDGYESFSPAAAFEKGYTPVANDPIAPATPSANLTQPVKADFTRATALTPAVCDAIEDAFEYHKWTPEQIEAGKRIRQALAAAVTMIVQDVPPGPDRTVAIRKIREARMDANSAITHGGKY